MKNIESRISIPADVDQAAEAVATRTGLSKPRVLGTFARYGQMAGAQSLLGPLGTSLADLFTEPRTRKNGRGK